MVDSRRICRAQSKASSSDWWFGSRIVLFTCEAMKDKNYRKQDHHAADELDLYKSSSLDVSKYVRPHLRTHTRIGPLTNYGAFPSGHSSHTKRSTPTRFS